MVNIGQYVAQGAPLLPLYSVDPIYINFSVPQKVVGKIAPKSKVTLAVDAFPGVAFEGEVTAINPNINESTRNVDVQATVLNASEQLKPGMFARISIDLGESSNVLVIPTSGIAYAPYGDTVYVVEMMKDKDGKEYKGVRQQIVQLGEQRGDLTQAVSGLKVGEEVVTTGAFKLRPQAPVSVHNDKMPSNSETPTVQDS
jgi:membrane fusion protein (multidrug efflux system)